MRTTPKRLLFFRVPRHEVSHYHYNVCASYVTTASRARHCTGGRARGQRRYQRELVCRWRARGVQDRRQLVQRNGPNKSDLTGDCGPKFVVVGEAGEKRSSGPEVLAGWGATRASGYNRVLAPWTTSLTADVHYLFKTQLASDVPTAHLFCFMYWLPRLPYQHRSGVLHEASKDTISQKRVVENGPIIEPDRYWWPDPSRLNPRIAAVTRKPGKHGKSGGDGEGGRSGVNIQGQLLSANRQPKHPPGLAPTTGFDLRLRGMDFCKNQSWEKHQIGLFSSKTSFGARRHCSCNNNREFGFLEVKF
ncbi:hypothetical protein J6590_047117 [Homalodisca vitripennis]|nr:hypothetical protein J6590_047117 [Homalodisca vitripennis]